MLYSFLLNISENYFLIKFKFSCIFLVCFISRVNNEYNICQKCQKLIKRLFLQDGQTSFHRPRPYCSGVLVIASMDSHLFCISLIGISQPRCSAISTEFRRWFREGNTNFGGENFLIKTLMKTWVKKNLKKFYTI